MQMSAMAGALLLVAGALAGAVAPGVQSLWEKYRDGLLTMSAGLLVGTSLLHLLPHALPLDHLVGYTVLAGFLGVLLLEVAIHGVMPEAPHQFVHEHSHAHDVELSHDHRHADGHEGVHFGHDGVDAHEQHLTISAVVGFSLHGIVDGVALFGAASAGTATTTAFALLAHHIPLAASCASLLRIGGRQRSYWPIVVVSAVMPVVGVVLAGSTMGKGNLSQYLCGFASGVFLYVATHNLLPVMDIRKGGGRRLVILLVGVGIAAVTEMIGG